MNLRRVVSKLLGFMFVLTLATVAQAVPVTVNPGAYQGYWSLSGERASTRSGIQTLDLAPGNQNIYIAGKTLNLDVAADGSVTSNNPAAATGGLGSLTFNAINVFVDPVNYVGYWYIGNVNSFVMNAQNIALVPGISYDLAAGASVGRFTFILGADGTVESMNPTAAVGGIGSLTFNNVLLQIDPNGFQGTLNLYRVFKRYYFDPQATALAEIVVIPGLSYELTLASGIEKITLTVDAQGNLTSDRPQSATVSGNKLTLLTSPVRINPQGYLGRYNLHSVYTDGGDQTFTLVKELSYLLAPNSMTNLAAGNNGYILVYLNNAGNVSSSWPTSVSANGNTLTFNNVPVTIDPGTFSGSWTLVNATNWQGYTGPQTLTLVPDWRYEIRASSQTVPWDRYFQVDAGGLVTSGVPESYFADGTSNTLLFKTVNIDLDPGQVLGNLTFNGAVSNLTGPTSFAVVPGLNHQLWLNGYSSGAYAAANGLPPFTINDPCSVSGFPPFLQNSAGLTLDVSSWVWSCPVVVVNTPPVADAGADQNVYLGETVQLDGLASSDPDGDALVSYTWTFDAAPVGSSFATAGVVLSDVFPSFVPDVAGEYILSLVVNDGELDSAAATVLVRVSENLAPLVTATADVISGVAPLTVTFDASLSSDPEGEALIFSWNFADPTTGVDNVSDLATTSHTFAEPGTYMVIVDVLDSFGNLSKGSVEILVEGAVEPPPVDDEGTLGFRVLQAKIELGKKGHVEGKVSLKVRFDSLDLPGADDLVVVSLDGVEVLNAPFSAFRQEHQSAEYELKDRNLKAELDMAKLQLELKRHKLILAGVDNRDGIVVKVSVGHNSGVATVDMKRKHDDEDGDRKLSCKEKHED